MRSAKSFVVLSLFVIAALILSACQPIVVPAPNAAPAIAAAYTPRFEPAPCRYPIPEGDKVECGYLVVPEDSGQPDGPTIRLHVVNFKSKSDTPKPDPVFVVHGGPGAAGGVIDWIWTSEPFASACRAVAQDIGPATAQVVEQLLADPVVDRLATARRLLKLRSRYDDGRLEAACHRALRFGDPAYRTVKRILDTGQDRQPLNLPAPTAIQVNAQTFMRTATEIFGDVLGGLRWN